VSVSVCENYDSDFPVRCGFVVARVRGGCCGAACWGWRVAVYIDTYLIQLYTFLCQWQCHLFSSSYVQHVHSLLLWGFPVTSDPRRNHTPPLRPS